MARSVRSSGGTGGGTTHGVVDVTTVSSPSQGDTAYNDGSTGPEGHAAYDGSDWIHHAGTVIE